MQNSVKIIIVMKDDEFKQKLSEVAEWKIPDTPRETSLNAKKTRGRKSAEEEYQAAHEEAFLEMFNGSNPTYPPMLVKLKIQPVDCGDCGQHCENGRVVESKFYETKDIPHWRKKCVTCGRWENPVTDQFDIENGTESSVVWSDFLRYRKGIYKTQQNQARKRLMSKSLDCDNYEIRINPENPHKI